MINSKLLATTLSLVLFAGVVTPAFAQAADSGILEDRVAGPIKAAGAVPTDGTWFEFAILSEFEVFGCAPADINGPGCIPSTGTPTVFADAPPWTFTCEAGGCWLTVTDAFDQDEIFEVFDNLVQIGTTSVPDFDGQCAPNDSDPEDCLADPDSSSGMFMLGPGAHSITFTGTANAENVGAAYFKVEQHLDGPIGGEFLSTDSTALVLAGLSQSAIWIIPTVLGIAGAGIYLVKFRTTKE